MNKVVYRASNENSSATNVYLSAFMSLNKSAKIILRQSISIILLLEDLKTSNFNKLKTYS